MKNQFDGKALGLAVSALVVIVLLWQVSHTLGIILLVAALVAAWKLWLQDPFGIYPRK